MSKSYELLPIEMDYLCSLPRLQHGHTLDVILALWRIIIGAETFENMKEGELNPGSYRIPDSQYETLIGTCSGGEMHWVNVGPGMIRNSVS